MKKNLDSQTGLSLLELLVSIILMLILLFAITTLSSQCLRIWQMEKTSTSLEQTARIATDFIIREVRYAENISLNNEHSLKVKQRSGEIITFQLGGDLHNKTLYMLIDRTAIPPGGFSANPITENVVTDLIFTLYSANPLTHLNTNSQAIIITLEVTDARTRQKYRIETAAYPWNSLKNLL